MLETHTSLSKGRKEERLNVIYIPVTGIGRHLGFAISNGLENFEGERQSRKLQLFRLKQKHQLEKKAETERMSII